MKPGNQADLRRHLESEYNIIVTKQAISLLFNPRDYRLKLTKSGEKGGKGKVILIEETAKLLSDSGFGEKAEAVRRKNGKAKPGKSAPEKPKEEDIDLTQPISLESQRSVIERHKAFHQSEKDRIKNEVALEKLIDIDDVGDKSFNLWRQLRDEIQSLKDRTVIKIRSAESEHEAEQVFNKEIHRILNSVVDGYQGLDDEALKKKLLLRLIE